MIAQLAAVILPFVGLLLFSRWAANHPRLRKLDLEAYLYLYPAFLVLGVFHIAPVIYSLKLSFYEKYTLYSLKFVGFDNYRRLWDDPQFWSSLVHTGWFVVGTVPGTIVLSMGVALLLNTEISGKGLYRTIYFLPVITSIAAISVVWKWVYNSESGLLNYVLRDKLGLISAKVNWLHRNQGIFREFIVSRGGTLPSWCPEGPSIAMLAVIALSIWKQLGYNAVIFLAGLQNIPKELYESARIDGAGAWGSFRHVTWPLLSPTTYFILIITTISSFQVFAQIYMLYDGLPGDSTRVIVYLLYETAFKSDKPGYASALAYALFGIIFALTMVQRKVAESKVHYQ